MVDKNGRQIQTGDVVLVSGGYFKSDNGLFAVIHAPGDPGWYGESCCLNKLCRSGKLSEGKYATAFWPIAVNNGHLDLVRLPDELDRMHEEAAADWFRGNCYLEAYNSPYDCTGQEFTNWFYLFRRHGHWFAYHKVCRDV